MAELELKEVSYFYESGGKRIDILDKASYSFEKGTLYTIVGPSGSGKTTTLTLAGALEEPKSGCVCFEGKDIREIGYTRYRNSKIGIVFQAYNLLPYLTPLENVLAAMEITSNPIKNKKERARELLTRMGITEDQMNRNINKLSGGEQQRVAIARAISTNAEVILADEPTGALDSHTSDQIMLVLRDHIDAGAAGILVTHEARMAAWADRTVFLRDGRIVDRSRGDSLRDLLADTAPRI